jgi:hypothetical protein
MEYRFYQGEWLYLQKCAIVLVCYAVLLIEVEFPKIAKQRIYLHIRQ